LILKDLRNLLPRFMFILSSRPPNLSIPNAHFPELLLSTLIWRRFQVIKPATLMIPIDLFPLVEGFYGTPYQNGSFSFFNVESDFNCLRSSFTFFLHASGKRSLIHIDTYTYCWSGEGLPGAGSSPYMLCYHYWWKFSVPFILLLVPFFTPLLPLSPPLTRPVSTPCLSSLHTLIPFHC